MQETSEIIGWLILKQLLLALGFLGSNSPGPIHHEGICPRLSKWLVCPPSESSAGSLLCNILKPCHWIWMSNERTQLIIYFSVSSSLFFTNGLNVGPVWVTHRMTVILVINVYNLLEFMVCSHPQPSYPCFRARLHKSIYGTTAWVLEVGVGSSYQPIVNHSS